MLANLKKESSVILSLMILVLAMSLSNILLAQDSNDPYHDRETEEVVDDEKGGEEEEADAIEKEEVIDEQKTAE